MEPLRPDLACGQPRPIDCWLTAKVQNEAASKVKNGAALPAKRLLVDHGGVRPPFWARVERRASRRRTPNLTRAATGDTVIEV